MPFLTHTLPNGLQLIGETSPTARSVAVGFFVRAGSRDEVPAVAGVSHFLEHMVFKGTERRSPQDVNLDFDRIGASYNAYTSEENTVFYAAVLPEYLPKAVDVLADILRPSLRQTDFDTEKKVIIEEIGMYDDQPSWSAYDHARKKYYGTHPLGNTVLGSVASITALTAEQMRTYFTERYVAGNITVSIAGNFDWSAFVGLMEKHCSAWPSGTVERVSRVPTTGEGGLHVITNEKAIQQYVIFQSAGPAADSPLRYVADTLALAVGDESGSRLYWALVDPGHADSADTSYYEYDANGTLWTTLSCEPSDAAANLERVHQVLRDVQRNSITESELQQAKSKIASRVVRGGERPMGRMQTIAHAWNYTGGYRDVDTELAAYDAVTLPMIRAFLDEYPLDRLTVTAYGPVTTL